MSFFKHVGVANGKKVIIIQRQLTGDDSHMAAVIYSDIMPTRYHDDVMAVLESEEGQQAWEFRDVLQRRMSSSGDNLLQTLSSENYIKRVAQNAIVVKPNSKSSIRLDELVKLLNEAGRGEAAVRKLEEMDAQLGMNSNPTQTNAARNQAKTAAELNEGPSVHYEGSAAPAAQSGDMNQLMMQMMQTMQAMQKEIADLKKPAKKTTKSKTAV